MSSFTCYCALTGILAVICRPGQECQKIFKAQFPQDTEQSKQKVCSFHTLTLNLCWLPPHFLTENTQRNNDTKGVWLRQTTHKTVSPKETITEEQFQKGNHHQLWCAHILLSPGMTILGGGKGGLLLGYCLWGDALGFEDEQIWTYDSLLVLIQFVADLKWNWWNGSFWDVASFL